MSIKRWFFYSAAICLIFLAGRATAAKPKTATVSTKINLPKYEAPKWEPIVTAQLARRDAQEQARQAQIKAAQAAEAARVAAIPKPKPTPVVVAVRKPQPVVSGSHNDWLAAAGVPADQWQCASLLIAKESGWRVNAYNPSGAYGIPQSLPGSKMASAGADWQTNPITQIRWMLGYVNARYGSFCGAWSHSQAVNWY